MTTLRLSIFIILTIHISYVISFVDNGVLGDPHVHCGADKITVKFDTRNTFKGIVFVENHLADPECRSAPVEGKFDQSIRNSSLSLGFKDCGIERRPSNDPKGIFLTTTLIVAFNAEYLTKIDRVYIIQCYYMEMENMLEKHIQVNMKPPTLQTQTVPMPVCRYEVLDGSPEGPPVFYAKIGQQVYHKWTCEAQTENQFCMVVHSCTVDDGNGDKIELIDDNGCAKDKYLLQNLDYVSDLMVGKEAHVYKYADKESMFFDCQITLTIKEPDQEYCDVPVCPDPPRRRRAQNDTSDVQQTRLTKTSESDSIVTEVNENEFIITPDEISHKKWINNHLIFRDDEICMSGIGITSMTLMNFILMGSSGLLFWNALRIVKSI